MLAAGRAAIRNTVFFAAILAPFAATGGHADEARPAAASAASGGIRIVADTNACGAKPLEKIPVAIVSNVPSITLLANGQPVTFVLDTGADRTVLTPAAAERIGAQPPRVEFSREMHGVAGTLPTREIELRSFSAGEVAIPWHRVVVAPVTMAGVFSTPLDGLLGADVLSNFDVDLDLPHQRMALYEKQACVSAPPWAGPYSGISTGRSRGEHLFFPVRLDGRGLAAFIDTGAQMTVLTTTAARALGVTATELARDRSITTRGATAVALSSHVHQFAQLTVGGETVRNPKIVVADAVFSDADIVLGADFLSERRIFLSYGSLRIFLSHR